jgi:peptidoglycan/xylan/chitin deacetylase (PgdA/CDA1 family)
MRHAFPDPRLASDEEGTMKWRNRLETLARSVLSPREPIVLMYHRVANLRNDPWELAVTPENFREHVRILSETRRVVPLRTLLEEARQGRGTGMVAITFDDGYVDVFENALPILAEFQCPATTFLVADALGRNREFWWDKLTRIVFDPPELPPALMLDIGDERFLWRNAGAAASANIDERGRKALYYALWRRLLVLDEIRRDECLGRLAEWADIADGDDRSNRAMSAEQAARMAAGGLMEIGAHTMSHPSLPALGPDGQRAEILRCRKACEEVCSRPVDMFAYPFGNFDGTSVALAREAGYAAAFTTRAGTLSLMKDPLEIPRANIGNFSGKRFRRALAMNFAIPNALPLSLSARLN